MSGLWKEREGTTKYETEQWMRRVVDAGMCSGEAMQPAAEEGAQCAGGRERWLQVGQPYHLKSGTSGPGAGVTRRKGIPCWRK